MSYGVTPTGFLRKDIATIKSELETALKGIFGSGLNVSAQSPQGQMIGLFAAMLAECWEDDQNSYDAFNPDAAAGAALSNLVQINGLTRKTAYPSSIYLDATGTDATVIPAGSLIGSTTNANVKFATVSENTISGGVATLYCECTETGPVDVEVGDLTQILTPVSGWTSVTNTGGANVGSSYETDAELRLRRAQSTVYGTSTTDSILGALFALSGVKRVKVYTNNTNTDNTYGGVTDAPHSVRAVLEGGDPAEIASTLSYKLPIGIATNGTEEYDGYHWDYVTETTIKIKATITTYANYPLDGDARIKQAIVDYFDSQLAAGYDYGIGDTVVSSRLYSPIVSIPGVAVTSVYIALSGTPTSSADIGINANARAVTSLADIEVVS